MLVLLKCLIVLHNVGTTESDAVALLQDLLADSNPMVVANAVAALAEITEVSGKNVFQITSQSLFKLLRALNECTEWGQVPSPFPPSFPCLIQPDHPGPSHAMRTPYLRVQSCDVLHA